MKINWTKVWKIVRVILEILVGLSAIGYYLECRELEEAKEELWDKLWFYRSYAYGMRRKWHDIIRHQDKDIYKQWMNDAVDDFENNAKEKDPDIYMIHSED